MILPVVLMADWKEYNEIQVWGKGHENEKTVRIRTGKTDSLRLLRVCCYHGLQHETVIEHRAPSSYPARIASMETLADEIYALTRSGKKHGNIGNCLNADGKEPLM